MKREIRAAIKKYFFESSVFKKEMSEINMKSNQQFSIKELVIKLIAYYIFCIITTISIIDITANSIVRSFLSYKEPLVGWATNSIQQEGLLYGYILSTGDLNLVRGLRHFYERRGAEYEVRKLDEIKEKMMPQNDCKK